MERDDGGSAFPQIETGYSESDHDYTGNVYSTGGMTLRDYFAAKALPALTGGYQEWAIERDADRVAQIAYSVADAMLKARSGQ